MCYDVACIEDVRQLVAAARGLSTVLDVSLLAKKASHELHLLLGTDFAAVALTQGTDFIAVRGVSGAQTQDFAKLTIPREHGVAGRVIQENRPVVVADYETDVSITHDFKDAVIRQEGIHGMAGVPILFGGEVIGILYAGNRASGAIGDRALTLLSEFSTSISPLIVTAERTERAREVAIQEERQAIAEQLHDTAGQILFNIGLSARALQVRGCDDENVLSSAQAIEIQASQASTYLREALHALSALSSEDALPVTVHRDARAFSERTGVPVEVIAIGEPFATSTGVDTAIVAVVREGLHNIEKHAQASSVFLTLFYGHAEVGLVMQDDGRGLPAGFSIQPVPGKARGLGLASLLQKVECLGGQLGFTTNEDGGVTLRVNIPEPCAG